MIDVYFSRTVSIVVWKFQLPWHLSYTPHLFPLPTRTQSSFSKAGPLQSWTPENHRKKTWKNSNAPNYWIEGIFFLTECMTNIDLRWLECFWMNIHTFNKRGKFKNRCSFICSSNLSTQLRFVIQNRLKPLPDCQWQVAKEESLPAPPVIDMVGAMEQVDVSPNESVRMCVICIVIIIEIYVE